MAAETRIRILRALRDIIADGGTEAVTLEAVAAAAGVSKGGLLYHFPSKAALYIGLLAMVRDNVRTEMAEATARLGGARGYLDYSRPTTADDEAEVFSSLIAVVRTGQSGDADCSNDEAATLLAEIFREWADPMRAAVPDPVQAEVIKLVGFGLYLTQIVGLPPTDPDLMAQVFERVLAMGERSDG